MSGIKRFSWNGLYGMEELPDGDYVLYSDHEAVVDSMTAALVKLDGACLASEQEIARLRAEVEAHRKDAERFRWLIQSMFSQWFTVGEAEIGMRVYGQCPSKEVIEISIDAAMGASA